MACPGKAGGKPQREQPDLLRGKSSFRRSKVGERPQSKAKHQAREIILLILVAKFS